MHRLLLFAFVALSSISALPAQSPAESTAIITALNKSAADWNSGDLDTFATSYKNSPDILFIGHTISRGYTQMLTAYKKNYPTRDKMGKLTFSQLEIQPLDAHFATVTGRFHLERTTTGGGNADGHYMLVVEHTPAGWKIIRDDTTADPTK